MISEAILFAQLVLSMDTGDLEVLAVLAVEGDEGDVPSFVGKSASKRVVLMETSSLKLK